MPRSDQGIDRERYEVIPRTLVFLVKGSQVLLLKGAADKRLWSNQYNGIGGHVERGEDLLSAARRELREETGLEAENLHLCGTAMVDAGGSVGVGIFIFRGTYCGGEPVPSAEGTLHWVEVERMNELPLVEDLKVILPLVLAKRECEAPFAARYGYDLRDRLQISLGE